MEIRLIMKTARSATLELDDGGVYETTQGYQLFLNGREYQCVNTVITGIYHLKPDTEYCIEVKDLKGKPAGSFTFRTEEEFVTINVKELGASGSGETDDTGFIQAAIMACPPKSRVLIPEGKYKVTSIFLKSGINLEIAKGAQLLAETDRNRYAKFPGMIESYDETDEYNLGTWEGNPLPMFAGILTGIGVSDVKIYGEGVINGCASYENWWYNEKVMVGAFRPRMLFLNRCERIQVQGLAFCSSPSWVIHPYFSNDLLFSGLSIQNPQQSPNTDGLDPYVQSKEPYPVDDATPSMKHFLFENINAANCHVAAAYFEGLPESKIEKIEMRNCNISFAEDAKTDVPIMSDGVGACTKKGIHAVNIETLVLDHVVIQGNTGEETEMEGVGRLELRPER